MRIKDKLQKAAQHIEDVVLQARVDNQEDWRRGHLGASGAGHGCDRKIWMDFHWVTDPQHEARLLALFQRGHLEEERFVSGLRDAGITVEEVNPETGDQWRVKWGNVGGSCDGVGWADFILDGVKFLLEFKTHSVKSFARLKAKKVRSSKKEHWVQMQLYMLGMGLKYALYMAVEKNSDEIYLEFIEFDEKKANTALNRVIDIVNTPNAPERLDEQFAPCVYTSKEGERYLCQHFSVCHEEQPAERNCRTCLEANISLNNDWSCDMGKDIKERSAQKNGCNLHVTLPGITNAKIASANKEERRIEWIYPSGKRVMEGPDEMPKPESVQKVCDIIGGKVVG